MTSHIVEGKKVASEYIYEYCDILFLYFTFINAINVNAIVKILGHPSDVGMGRIRVFKVYRGLIKPEV